MYVLKDREMNTAVVGYHYNVNKSVIHVIKKHEDKFKGSAKVSAPLSVIVSCVSFHDSFLKDMETDGR
jgi:hypothetical protein